MEGRMKTAHDITEQLRTDDVLNDENSNVDFASLLLSGPVLEGLEDAGFQRPSPIQLKAIPLGRCGLDLVIQAKSGTGKTCVFSVIALESIDLSSSATQVLILAPTREIAVQIQQVILDIGRMMPNLRCHVFIGGTLIGPDKQNLKKCHIAVGTPGRLKQLIETGVLVPDSIRLFILDEADKLLDDKFQSQINWIYNELPYNKQMLAASATYPEYLAHHLTSYMRDATFVRLNPKEIALHGIRQYYKLVEGHELPHKAFAVKVNELITLLSNVTFQQCLVFSNLHTRAENLCDILCQRGWQSVFMSGGLEQKQRLHAMSTFKKFECRVLISTDLTARGIDAEKVNLVINLDVPVDVKTYLHRIGRAGRFGTYGAAITLASFGREELLLHSIQKESHVPIRLLPDPVPSDLLSPSAEVSGEPLISKDFISNSEEDYHDDKHTMDNQQYTSKSRQSRLSTSALAKQSGDSLTVSFLNGESSLQDESVNLRFSMAPVKKPVMVDKGCQVDDPNSVLNLITSEIPSLKETLNIRRCYPTWFFSAALKDFKHFKKTGNFESEADNKVMGKSVIEDVNHDTRTFSQNNHMTSEKDIQRTISPPEEDREKKKENESDEFQLQVSNDSMNSGFNDEHYKTDCINFVTKEALGDGKADRSSDTRMDKIDEINNSRPNSDSKRYEEPHINNKISKSNTVIRNEKMNIMDPEEIGKDRISLNESSSKGSWTDEEEEEEEEEEDEEEEEEEESYDGDETDSNIVESSISDEKIATENTSSSDDSEDDSDTSQTDEEEDSASKIYMIKDGVVVQVNSKKQCSSRKTVSKEVEDSSEDLEKISHSKEVPEIEETTLLSCRRDVSDRRQEEVRNKRKETHQQSGMTSNELYSNNPYYDCSGYQYYYNGAAPGSHHQMSHMGYHPGPSYQDFGWSGLHSWPYAWQVPYWPAYPAATASLYHQHPVPGNHGPEWYPPGYSGFQSNARQSRSQEYEQKY